MEAEAAAAAAAVTFEEAAAIPFDMVTDILSQTRHQSVYICVYVYMYMNRSKRRRIRRKGGASKKYCTIQLRPPKSVLDYGINLQG